MSSRLKTYRDDSFDLAYYHFDTGHEAWTATVEKEMPNARHFVVVRDPIMSLCTFYKNTSRRDAHKQVNKVSIIQNNMALYRMVQTGYLETHDPYIHRVEDPIATLGDWAGVQLRDDGNRHSQPNDLREAVLARDLDKVADIINYGTLFEWFVTTHSANIAPLYRDQLGYDFWWYK
jgi:hypothetical protein